MKTLLTTIFAGALLLGFTSCSKETKEVNDDNGLEPTPTPIVTLKARIADETKATLNETTGAFAFSVGDAIAEGDAIKVCNDKGAYASTGISINNGVASFTMASGFEDIGTGLAAFPAGIVSDITKTTVTFTLPSTYTYSQVGGLTPAADADASLARVPCPMISTYTSQSDLYFKQAGAVVRFRLTDCVAGSITFTFTTKVTGTVTLTGVPDGDNGGYHASDLSDGGYSITVTNVPEVTSGKYIFITLPVPTGTDPLNVGIWNNGTAMNKVATLRNGSPISLNRAGGYKRGASLTDVKETATFNEEFLAGDLSYTGNYNYAIMEDPLEVLTYYSRDYTTSGNTDSSIKKCFFNWNFLETKGFTFTINGKSYRVPTSGKDNDWAEIAGTKSSRPAAKVKGNTSRYAYVTVNGLDSETYHTTSIGGIILFPDNAIIAVPTGSGNKMDIFDADDNGDNNTLTLDGLHYLLNQGCSFIPTAGFWNNSNWYKFYWERGWYGINEAGSYWSGSILDSDYAYALTILRNHTKNSPRNLIDPAAYDKSDIIYLPVRLIRVPPASPTP